MANYPYIYVMMQDFRWENIIRTTEVTVTIINGFLIDCWYARPVIGSTIVFKFEGDSKTPDCCQFSVRHAVTDLVCVG